MSIKKLNTHHSFDVQTATKIGVHKAVILQNIQWWLAKNKANNINIKVHDDVEYYWTYNSGKAFNQLFPYISGQMIRRYLTQLEEDGFIISNAFNSDPRDRTKWYSMSEYAVNYEELHCYKSNNALLQKYQPLPDINKTNKNKEKNILKKEFEKKENEIPTNEIPTNTKKSSIKKIKLTREQKIEKQFNAIPIKKNLFLQIATKFVNEHFKIYPNMAVCKNRSITDLKEYAVALHELHSKDGYEIKTISNVMKWLITHSDGKGYFWVRNLHSLLRIRTMTKNDISKFDTIHNDYEEYLEKQSNSCTSTNTKNLSRAELIEQGALKYKWKKKPALVDNASGTKFNYCGSGYLCAMAMTDSFAKITGHTDQFWEMGLAMTAIYKNSRELPKCFKAVFGGGIRGMRKAYAEWVVSQYGKFPTMGAKRMEATFLDYVADICQRENNMREFTKLRKIALKFNIR